MHEIARLGGERDAIDLDSVEREATPEPAMRLGTRAHLACQFYNRFSHARPETVESWSLALAWALNNLI